jgi:hypothetical protein
MLKEECGWNEIWNIQIEVLSRGYVAVFSTLAGHEKFRKKIEIIEKKSK